MCHIMCHTKTLLLYLCLSGTLVTALLHDRKTVFLLCDVASLFPVLVGKFGV